MGWIEGVIASFVVGYVSKTLVPKLWQGLMVKLRKDAKAKAEQLLKDPEWRSIVSQIVLKVQKEAGSESSIKKLNQAVDWIVAFSPIPDNLERPVIEAMVEQLIAETKKPIDIM